MESAKKKIPFSSHLKIKIHPKKNIQMVQQGNLYHEEYEDDFIIFSEEQRSKFLKRNVHFVITCFFISEKLILFKKNYRQLPT
jgi:hypothetical protein